MSEGKVNSEDIEMVFQRLRALPGNKTCFDCNSKNPTWSSITYGVFICLDCSAVHRSMGVHLTFVRSTQLDTNWTWLQLRQMQLGGNSNATAFFRQHNCMSKDAQQKYNSRAAQLYRDKLLLSAKQAMTTFGTQLFLDQLHTHEIIEVKPVDFFEQHTANVNSSNENFLSNNLMSFTSKQGNGDTPLLRGPKILNDAEQKSIDHKTLLGGRQAHSKRSGLGGKKLGLGAQKVRTNFADIEKEAELADKVKFNEPEKTENLEKSTVDQAIQMSSMRLAYQDLSFKKSKEEEKLKQIDPKKAAQLERLGMGFTSKNIVSHSAVNDMLTLDKEVKKQSLLDHSEDKFYDCFEEAKTSDLLQILSKNRQITSDDFFDFDDSIRSSKTHTPSKVDVIKNDWDNIKPAKKVNIEDEVVTNEAWDLYQKYSELEIAKKGNKDENAWEVYEKLSVLELAKKKYKEEKKNRKKKNEITPQPSENNKAFKKFGGAKSISSTQYFGDNQTLSEKSNLSRFEGSNSISSAELFGREEITNINSTYQPPDLDDVKESVKQGVTKVAGKLSSLANGMMSSFQEKYGGY